MNNTRDKRKIICRRCNGDGIIPVATGDADKCRNEQCPKCNGVGMMIRITIVEYQPISK